MIRPITMIPSTFIVVDNDPVNNLLCDLAIRDEVSDANFLAFTDPLEAFDHISASDEGVSMNILLLDINMPIWSGWDFVEHFDKLDENIKSRFRVYMLSSSIDSNDKQRAMENKNVVDYIEKPLTKEKVFSLL
jgi:CheY-like chemotaxis protein